ncbi:hypothetical protein AYO44_13765 [Planctomycetaceae bacterium SCGC AG-212-F19]|nr:hypothetical protein AYO44_13765 [Planctomycetaceae bacterium SCGC AG-212-F19]
MRNAQRILALQRKQASRSKQPPNVPLELRTVPINELPGAVQQLLETTPLQLREDLIEQLVWAVKSKNEFVKDRAWICLVSLGGVAVSAIGEQLLHQHRDTRYRLRLIYLLGEIGQQHREAMAPLLHLLSATKVPEILAAATSTLMGITAGQPVLGEGSPGILPGL